MDAEEAVVRSAAGGCTIAVWVVPRAARDEVTGVFGNALRIRVRAVPEKGAANRAAAAMLARALGGAEVTLRRGAAGRRKLFAVALNAAEARLRLGL